MHKLIFTTALLLSSLPVAAQRHGVIANAETGVPLRDVAVYTNAGTTAVTDWRGEYRILVPFTSATIVKPDFVSLTVDAAEMTDTLYLLPRLNSLAEVVVWGKRRRYDPNAVSSWQPSFVPNTPATGGIGGLDIIGLFYKKRPMSTKDLEKHREIMREY